MTETQFSWIKAYEKIADAVLEQRSDPQKLLDVFSKLSEMDNPEMESSMVAKRDNIDPFTFFTSFNRGAQAPDRAQIVEQIMEILQVDAPVPTDFIGLPTANHELWQYFDQSEQGIEQCWDLFEQTLAVADADKPTEEQLKSWGKAFDAVHEQEHINKANLTRALYWVRPRVCLPLGGKTRPYIHDRYGINPPYSLTGLQYLRLLQEVSVIIDDSTIPEIAASAYKAAHADSWWPPDRDFDPCISASQWEEFLSRQDFFDEDMLKSVQRMYELGGHATCDELAEKYGKTREYYSKHLQACASCICNELGFNGFKGSMWPVMFFGQNADETRTGDYVWKMRPELFEACKKLFQHAYQLVCLVTSVRYLNFALSFDVPPQPLWCSSLLCIH